MTTQDIQSQRAKIMKGAIQNRIALSQEVALKTGGLTQQEAEEFEFQRKFWDIMNEAAKDIDVFETSTDLDDLERICNYFRKRMKQLMICDSVKNTAIRAINARG